MIEPVQLFKCLSDKTRLHASMLIFIEGELCVCELMEALNDNQPKISRHLSQLRSCGILNDVRRGHWVYYSISKSLPDWAKQILDTTSSTNKEALLVFQKNLKAMKNRPQSC